MIRSSQEESSATKTIPAVAEGNRTSSIPANSDQASHSRNTSSFFQQKIKENQLFEFIILKSQVDLREKLPTLTRRFINLFPQSLQACIFSTKKIHVYPE
jgi:hypothetical protein